MNTVVANEAIVHHYAADPQYKGKVDFYGVNPGMLLTDIRNVMHGGSATFMGSCVESIVSCLFRPPPMPKYAESMWSAFLSPALAPLSGKIINQQGTIILPMKEFSQPGRRACGHSLLARIVDDGSSWDRFIQNAAETAV